MDKVRWAVVGLYGIGPRHIREAQAAEEVELVALCDVDGDLAKRVADEAGVQAWTDFGKLLKSGSVDAVSLSLPHHLHAPMAIQAMEAGLHVLVEKPIAVTVGEADDMIAAAKATGRKLGVAHVARIGVRHIKQAIAEGAVGDLFRMLWTSYAARSNGYYRAAEWRGKWLTEGGGVLINQCIHDMDALQWLCGPVVEVRAMLDNLEHDVEVEDIGSAALRFASGALGAFDVGLCTLPQLSRREFAGDLGIIVSDEQGTRIGKLSFPVRQYLHNPVATKRGSITDSERPKVTWEDLPAPEPWERSSAVRDLALAIMEDGEPFVPAHEGIRALELMNAMVLSHFRQKPVTIPVHRAEYAELLQELAAGKHGPWRGRSRRR